MTPGQLLAWPGAALVMGPSLLSTGRSKGVRRVVVPPPHAPPHPSALLQQLLPQGGHYMASGTLVNSRDLVSGLKPSQDPALLVAPRQHWWLVPGLGTAPSSAGTAPVQGWVRGQPSCLHSGCFSPWLPSRRWGWLGGPEPPQPPAAMAERDIKGRPT